MRCLAIQDAGTATWGDVVIDYEKVYLKVGHVVGSFPSLGNDDSWLLLNKDTMIQSDLRFLSSRHDALFAYATSAIKILETKVIELEAKIDEMVKGKNTDNKQLVRNIEI